MRLSVLDQTPGIEGEPEQQGFIRSLALARHCEALGYHRYWVGEHHDSASFLGCAPEVLLGALTQVTTRMRLGAGAVQLPHYAPYKVAEQFAVLDALAPGRIDIGLGKSPGEPHVQAALRRGAAPPPFLDDVQAVLDYLADGIAHEGVTVRAHPVGAAATVWMMGGSEAAARDAARLGLPYCHNYSDRAATAEAAMAVYRAEFVPSPTLAEPYAAAMVWALVAPDAEEAEILFRPRQHWRVMLSRGHRVPALPPHAFDPAAYTEAERALLAAQRDHAFVGATGAVAEALETLAARLGVEELVVCGWTHDEAARQRSYTLLAEALL